MRDSLYALYARVHEARGGNRLETLSAYLSTEASKTLAGLGAPQQVHSVVVGAMQYIEASQVRPYITRVGVTVRFEANYTEVGASGQERAYYVAEEWRLSRDTAAQSRPPEQARVFKCPHCGAPLEGMRGGVCAYCEQRVNTGQFDWMVNQIDLQERERRGPQLGGETPEQGTNLPTRVQTNLDMHWSKAQEEDPDLSWETFSHRLETIFQELQVAWSCLLYTSDAADE